MKVYVILKEDHGYLGYGRDIGSGSEVESVHKSLEDAWYHLQGTYKNLSQILTPEECRECEKRLKAYFRWFNETDNHAYEFTIFEEELA